MFRIFNNDTFAQ